jgi:hypothetical protein
MQLIMSMPPQFERSEPEKPQRRPHQIRDDKVNESEQSRE